METILAILVIAAFAILAYLKSPSGKGKLGELNVGKQLSKLPSEYVVMNDVVLPTRNGTSQIDHIVVSPYGIFGIETKNYHGEIYGDDDRQEWTQMIITEVRYAKKWWKTYTYVTKNHFYNPVRQSLGHIYTIKDKLPEFGYVPLIPIVVFAGQAVLANVTSRYPVVYIEELVPKILEYQQRYLTDDTVNTIVSQIQSINVRDTVKTRDHVRNVRQNIAKQDLKITQGVCPRCGGRLVLRSGKYGSFYGCSNYPKCKFTRNV